MDTLPSRATTDRLMPVDFSFASWMRLLSREVLDIREVTDTAEETDNDVISNHFMSPRLLGQCDSLMLLRRTMEVPDMSSSCSSSSSLKCVSAS
jgi:hypothetical protein